MPDKPDIIQTGCTADGLYQTLLAGYPPHAARALILDLIRADNVATDPVLTVPVEIMLHAETDAISFVTAKEVIPGSRLRISPIRSKTIDLPKPAGCRDEYDWEKARRAMRNLFLRATAFGGDEPDMVVELCVYFDKLRGDTPSDRSLQEHIAEWRKAGDYDRLFPRRS